MSIFEEHILRFVDSLFDGAIKTQNTIDLLRGLVMIIMALDHVRDFFHLDALAGNSPLDFATTSPLLFLTRWITHFCAPVFIFLSGSSVFFVSERKSKKDLSYFLFTRGLWLIILEVTVISFGWQNNFQYYTIVLQVIWAIGLSMVFLSLFIFLPKKLLLVIGLVIVFGHNALDGINEIHNTVQGFIWSVLHVRHRFPLSADHAVFVLYPALPWFGLMILGYLFGELYSKDFDAGRRKKILLQLGSLLILLFIMLRFVNIYGDAHHWHQQSTVVYTILSFVDTTKYPPSLLYLLMTIGPAMIFLTYAENSKSKLTDAITIYGRVPLFYYVMHIYLIHVIAWVLFFATGHSVNEIDFSHNFTGFPKSFGFHLWQVYLIWAFVVLTLYLPCKWYNSYKSTRGYWWLSYL